MASPRAIRRKISLPMLRTPSRARKQSFYGNRLGIDHLDAQSHIAFLRKVSVNPNEIMYPINISLPNGTKQVIVVPGASKLKDVLREVRGQLPDDIDTYALEDTTNKQTVSLTAPSVDFVGKDLLVIKTSEQKEIYEKAEETGRLQLVKDLCTSEKQFRDRIHCAQVIYKVPLKSWGLNEAEVCLLFDGTTNVEITSNKLIQKLEHLVGSWHREESCIGQVFDDSFWQTHENYGNFYNLAKLTLKSKRGDTAFASFLNMQRGVTGKPTLEALILAPLQRVPQYDNFMTELILTTPADHKDRRGIERTSARLRQLSEKRSDDLHREEREFKIIQVQEKFPNDKLDLDLSWSEYERFKYRRYNSPHLRSKKGNPPDIELEKRSYDDFEASSPTSSFVKRLYIQEGPVKLSNATSTNERYLFLFNDLLIVAKPKSASTFKLKERIRVSELWLSNCIDEVTEASITHEKAFVIGWPTTNYVASFNLIEEKELWFNALQKSINERRESEEPKEINIKIANKSQPEETQAAQTCSVTVSCKDEARSVIKTSLEQFQHQNDDPNDYQLMIIGKDGTSYPLIGHELPYAIRMNHIRTFHEFTHDENDNQYDHSTSFEDDGKVQFVLKKAKKGTTRNNLDIANNQKKWKIKKSPIINWAMNKKTVKPAFNSQDSMPVGKLFRNPLVQLSNEEEPVPKPIQDIMVQLFRRGPGTSGIFRRPALQRTAKQIRQMLDEGKEVDFEDTSSIVLATVLKEFFRTLPESLIVSDQYDNLLAAKNIADTEARVEEIKTILRQVPKAHYELLMRFLCVLYHIQRYSEQNKMTSYNLAICVSPSIMFLPVNSKLVTTEQATGGSDVVCFMIDNFVQIFSRHNEFCLGEESDIQFDDSDSDSTHSDQHIYKYGEEVDEVEPITPDFLVSPVEDREPGVISHSDSSLNTNDSDELKIGVNNNLSIPTISLSPDKISGSKSSPNSPMMRRKKVEKTVSSDARMHSDWSDHEGHEHENFQRRLLRQPRPKRMLSSTTTSAELIEHKRHIVDSAVSVSSSEKTREEDRLRDFSMSSIDSSKSLPSSATLVPQKHIISQPVIQHFATEYRPTPNLIFHAVDRRRQPAAPSYEEHIQRTQSKHRVVKTSNKRQPTVAHATVVQHQSTPVTRSKKMSGEVSPKCGVKESSSHHSISSISSNEERRTATLSRKPRVQKGEKPTVVSPNKPKTSIEERFFPSEIKTEPAAEQVPKKKITKEEDSMIRELLDNLTETNSSTEEQVKEEHEIEGQIQKERLNSKDNIEDTFNSIMDSLQHNVELNGNISKPESRKANKTSPERTSSSDAPKKSPPPTAPKPKLSRNSSSSTNKTNEHEDMFSLSSILSSFSDTTSPTRIEDGDVFIADRPTNQQPSQSPFTLTLKGDLRKSQHSSQSNDDKAQSLVLEKTLLTKAPKKIDQLTLKLNERREDQAHGRSMTARELRKTNRRLKSEIRNAFNEGKFNLQHKDKPVNETSQKHVTLNNNLFNGHISTEGIARENIKQQNKENLPSPLNLANLLVASRQRYNENNNKTSDDSLEDAAGKNTDSSDAAYAEIMSQAESYV